MGCLFHYRKAQGPAGSIGGINLQKILIVEDDDNIRDMVLYALSSTEFVAEGFGDGESFWTALEQQAMPALLLLDIMLPGEDGIAILRKMKQSPKYKMLPVIILSAKGTEYDRIKGLDLGADDYITKPFSVLEVISRIRAVLRRFSSADNNRTVEIGKIVLRTDKRSVFADGREAILTYKEFELLHYLMLNEGIVLTRDKLLEDVWGFDYNGESRTIDMHIKSLRQKLGVGSDIIKTVRNVGYKVEG